MACVKFCLDDKTYRKLMGTYADIVISCGSSLGPLNVLLSRENNAKNIIIMKPSLVSLKRFNLAIIPKHDKPSRQKNVLVTTGSPNRISENFIQKHAQRFSSELGLKKSLKLGLLLGGDNPDYKMAPELIKNVITQMKAMSKEFDLDILATTSRRTPKKVVELLKENLAKFPGCKLLVIASEKNIDGTIPAILGLSKIVLVSGESISMISEAASSGKHTLVFPLERKTTRRTRHDSLVTKLDRAGFIELTGVDEIGRRIENALKSKTSLKKLNDYERIYNVVGGLL